MDIEFTDTGVYMRMQDEPMQDVKVNATKTRAQLMKLLQWNASSHVTDAMLQVAVSNRLHLGRLTREEVAAA